MTEGGRGQIDVGLDLASSRAFVAALHDESEDG